MQTGPETLAADARVRALSGKLIWAIILPGVIATMLFALALVATAFIVTSDAGPLALNMDFRVFWAAGRLAYLGEPLASFDMVRLATTHNVAPEAWMPWLYPPGYLVLLIPLGSMNFAPAFLMSTVLSIVLMGVAIRPFVARTRSVWLAMTLAPACIAALIIGQNSLIWTAGLLAALAALRDGRWVLAGVFIGCLTLKPQLGLMIPVALLAFGLWRTILTATVTAVLLAALPTLAFGPQYWTLLADRLTEISGRLVETIHHLPLMVGPFSLFTQIGIASGPALYLQWTVTGVCALAIAILWRDRRVSFDTKAAGLLTAILLSSPYLWYYEAAMMPAIGLFLVRAGLLGRSLPQLALLFGLWLGAGLLAMNSLLGFADPRLLGAVLVTPILMACAVIIQLDWAKARGQRAPTSPT